MKKKYTAVLAVAILAGFSMTAQAVEIPQKLVLGGKVVSSAVVGTEVKEGETLVSVETLAGPVPAAKATAAGKVKEIRVKAGDAAASGEVAAIIETK